MLTLVSAMNQAFKVIIEKACIYGKADLTPQLDVLWVKFCIIPIQRAWRVRLHREWNSVCGMCSGITAYCGDCISDLPID